MNSELIKSIAAVLWPIIVLIALYKFGPLVIKLIGDATDVKIKMGGTDFSFSKQQTEEIFIKPILNELDDAISTLLNKEQRLEFLKIYQQVYGQGVDLKVPDDFERESNYHKHLRALRNVNFIRPLGGGAWLAGKRIEIQNLGRLAVKLKKKELEKETES